MPQSGNGPQQNENGDVVQAPLVQANAEGPMLMDVPQPPEPDEPPPWLGLAQFHSNETTAMRQKYRHVEDLLTLGHHSLSEGTFCESLLRELLRASLPNQFAVDTGFILGNQVYAPLRRTVAERRDFEQDEEGPPTGNSAYKWRQTCASPQLDIMIHDIHHYTPILRSDDFVVVLPGAVKAVIEVKKTLRVDSFKDALHTLAQTRFLIEKWMAPEPSNVITCVFAFEAEKDLRLADADLSSSFRSRLDGICDPFPPKIGVPSIVAAGNRLVAWAESPESGAAPIELSWVNGMHNNMDISGQLLLFHLMKRLALPTAKRFHLPGEVPVGGPIEFANPAVARHPLTNPK